MNYWIAPGINTNTDDKLCDRILLYCAQAFGIKLSQLQSKSRRRRFVEARHLSMYLMRKYTSMTLMDIAKASLARDHTSALYAVNNMERLLRIDSNLRKMASEIEFKL